MVKTKRKSKEGYVNVTGGKIWYQIVGEGDATPLILLHGGPGSTHWGFQPLEPLADERPVVFYDQLGCGSSDRPDNLSLWTAERFVEELSLLRKALGLDRVHILGHSWGSMLATDYYLTEPDGVESLILSSPCISIPRWLEDCADYIKQMPQDMQETIRKHQESGTFDSPGYKAAEDEFYKRHVNRVSPMPEAMKKAREGRGQAVYEAMWGPNEFYMDGNLKGYDRSGRLNEIKVPTLFSCGRVDEAAPATTEWYASLTPGAEFVVYENSAHMPHWEESKRYVSVVLDFLRRAENR